MKYIKVLNIPTDLMERFKVCWIMERENQPIGKRRSFTMSSLVRQMMRQWVERKERELI